MHVEDMTLDEAQEWLDAVEADLENPRLTIGERDQLHQDREDLQERVAELEP